eukprot:3187960-Prymnesium_polylepis.1
MRAKPGGAATLWCSSAPPSRRTPETFFMMLTGWPPATGFAAPPAIGSLHTGRAAQTIADWIAAWRSGWSSPSLYRLSTSIRLRCIDHCHDVSVYCIAGWRRGRKASRGHALRLAENGVVQLYAACPRPQASPLYTAVP